MRIQLACRWLGRILESRLLPNLSRAAFFDASGKFRHHGEAIRLGFCGLGMG